MAELGFRPPARTLGEGEELGLLGLSTVAVLFL
jgi:hypothetical protein